MSLFEKLNNKRYNLQEAIDDKGNITPEPGDIAKEKSILRNIKKKQVRLDKNQKKIINTNTKEGDKLLKDINKRKSQDLTRADAINRSMDSYDDGDLGNPNQSKSSTATKTKTVSQAEVSKQAKDFTKKINKKRTSSFDNVTGEGQVKYPKTKDQLITKRKEYGIDRKGNISDAGVKRYAQKTKQLSSGSNLPVTPSQKELDIAKKRAVGGTPIKNKAGKVIGTTTGKYGGKLSRKRPSNAPSFADVKAKIDAKNPTYKSPLTGGQLPNIGSPESQVKRLDPKKYKELKNLKGTGGMPKGTVLPDGTIKPKMPKTVLKVVKPDLANPTGFKRVDTMTKEGEKIFKKQVSTDELLSGRKIEKKIIKDTKSGSKPNLFGRIKNFVKTTPEKLKKIHRNLVGPGSGYTSTKTGNITKKIYKNTLRGNSAKIIDKILPGKYKAVVGIPAIAVGAYLATRKPKDVAADKGKITYKKVEKPLGFDTGRKINQDRISYNQFLKKNNITDPQQKTLLAKQKERSDNAAARARRNSSKPTQKSMKNLS